MANKNMNCLIGLFCLVVVAEVAAAEKTTNVLYELLITNGVTLSDGTIIKLPLPSLADDTKRDKEQQTIEKVADRYPYQDFVRDSISAPYRIVLESVKDKEENRTGQTVDVWFVAYGTLEAIEKNELLEELGNVNRAKAIQQNKELHGLIDKKELEKRGITVATENQKMAERYGYFDGPLLNKVQLSGVTRSILTRGTKSTLSAIALDDRFLSDEQFPNQWRSLKRDALGKVQLGSAHPYSGFGGYVKVTKLIEPGGALLVEMHIVFDEPQGWFGGANLLRTKLPLAIRENVRTFRKKLKDVTKPKSR